MTEALENRRKRLIFRSWHRGTREMDLLMGSFADKHVPDMDDSAIEAYEELLSVPDPDLYDWYIGKPVPADETNAILPLFLAHKIVSS